MGYYNECLNDKNIIMAPKKEGCLLKINNNKIWRYFWTRNYY